MLPEAEATPSVFVLELLFYPFNHAFIGCPYLALVPALLFGVGYWRLRAADELWVRGAVLSGAIAWLVYALDEWWMTTAAAEIRMDLLLLGPILYLATLGGLVGMVVSARRQHDDFRDER